MANEMNPLALIHEKIKLDKLRHSLARPAAKLLMDLLNLVKMSLALMCSCRTSIRLYNTDNRIRMLLWITAIA